MSQTLITPTIIAKEALFQLKNNLVMGRLVHTQYKDEFVKVGASVNIRKPVKFVANSGSDITSVIQDVEESNTSITVDQRYNVAWKFSSEELTTTVEQYSERYIKPAVIKLANRVDYDLCGLYDDVPALVGTPGTTPSSFAALGAAAQWMDDMAVPTDQRKLVLNPKANWALADALKGLYDTEKIRKMVEKGYLANIAGMEIYTDQNIRKHTNGAYGTTPMVQGGSQTGSSIITDGWGTSQTDVLKAGDVITFAGCYAVNPVNYQSTGELMQFTLTADADSNSTGTGESTLAIYPAIVTSGAKQNVTASPTNDGAVTLVGGASKVYTNNLAFHKNAFALVTLPLAMPDGVSFKAQEKDPDTGLSIRVLKDFDILTDEEIIRLDIFYGVKAIYPELAVRVAG